jgi:hypothetical protein
MSLNRVTLLPCIDDVNYAQVDKQTNVRNAE